MRILFDRHVPSPLRRFLTGHRVDGTSKHGWSQLQNGDLLKATQSAGFDVMVTADQNIAYQQNLAARKIALIVLGSGNLPIIRNHLPEIITAVDEAKPGSYAFIEMPLPQKPEYQA